MSDISRVKMLEFSQKGDEKGYLAVVKGKEDIPFESNGFFIFTVPIRRL